MRTYNTNAYWDNDFDRMFDEAVDELARAEREQKEGGAEE